MKWIACLILMFVIVTALAWTVSQPGLVSAQPAPQSIQTPVSQTAEGREGLPLWAGVIILLAPLGWMIWKSRGPKQPDIKGACCLPVVKEGERPFQIYEDDPVTK